MEDKDIVELFINRDEDAIKYTSEKYAVRLTKIAYGIVEDFESARECENDTYLQAWNLIPPNEPKEYFYAFLARIVRNIALNICRERNALKRKAFIDELSDEMAECLPGGNNVDDCISDILLKEALNGFLATLDEEKRYIFIRRYWFLDSIKQIAKRNGISQSKVKMSLLRSRQQLKDYLEKEGYMI